MKTKVIYNFTNIASHYRSLLWQKLLSSENFEFHFLFGTNKSLKIKEIDFTRPEFVKQEHKLHKLKNFWLKGSILIWQSGVIKKCLSQKIDTAIFLGEFQVISTWVAMLICKLRGIQVIYWTHGLYGNESSWKKNIRVFFYKSADKLLLYERRAKKLLIAEGMKSEKLKVVFNSLDYDTHLKIRKKINKITDEVIISFFGDDTLPYLIFVGRLTEIKKIDLLLDAIGLINKDKARINLLIIGEGAVKDKLQIQVNNLLIENNVHFYGACYDESTLAKLIYESVLCVSPGNVGLTAVHSLSFGTPVCTHSNLYNQMPEVESIEEGVTGCYFDENNINSLQKVIIKWIDTNQNSRNKIRTNCYKVIDELYNPYNQIKVIENVIDNER